MHTKVLILMLTLVMSLLVVGLALADTGVELSRWALSGGASDSSGESVALRATLGQPIVGIVSSSATDITLGQGFWHGGSLSDGYEVYLPLIQR